MWYAPTAEDWDRPVLLTFQRTWADAIAVSQETGKAILICVNMDGEIASEHYAGIRYRQPEIATLYEPYVLVMASVYRHTARDFDEKGQRILCPRFGSVTCGEHIAIEPFLYENFFDGQRIAPRHIMVELDGKETYDVFYAFDTVSVFNQIRDGIETRTIQPNPIVRGDRTVIEKVASRDIKDREDVEAAYLSGDREMQENLLKAALENPDAEQIGMIRLALFGFDTELSKIAREVLTKAKSDGAVDLLNEALRVPMDESERATLVAALERLGESSAKARTLSVVHKGMATTSDKVDARGWTAAAGGGASYAPAKDWTAIDSSLESKSKAAAERPKDPQAMLELAEDSLALAVDPKTSQILSADRRSGSTYARLMFEDAKRAAVEAEKLGATGWRVNATIALSSYYLGERREAYRRAEAAVADIPSGSQEWAAISTIALFAEARQLKIGRAVRNKEDWPGEWLTDLNNAYEVLAKHPLGTDVHAASHYDFLKFLEADLAATRVLDAGLERFPSSWVLHDRLRGQILEDQGAVGLEPAYAAMLAEEDAPASTIWFAAYNSIVAAEYYRRMSNDDEAIAAYGRSLDFYVKSVEANPASKDSADHYSAIALGGRARIYYEKGEYDKALADLLVSFTRKPDAAANLDGLNISAVDTAKMMLAKFRELEMTQQADVLDAAMNELDPELLLLPPYEGQGPGPMGAGRTPGRTLRGRGGRGGNRGGGRRGRRGGR
jgi:tetratricopeptide (TPR) repeat protein